jgi:hypothetical protein
MEQTVVNNTVVQVYAFKTDLVIKLRNDEGSYYLNRYLDDGGTIDSFRKLLLGKEVDIKYVHSIGLLNPRGRSRPIDTLYLGDSVKMFLVNNVNVNI